MGWSWRRASEVWSPRRSTAQNGVKPIHEEFTKGCGLTAPTLLMALSPLGFRESVAPEARLRRRTNSLGSSVISGYGSPQRCIRRFGEGPHRSFVSSPVPVKGTAGSEEDAGKGERKHGRSTNRHAHGGGCRSRRSSRRAVRVEVAWQVASSGRC